MEFLGTKEPWSVYNPSRAGCTNVIIGDCKGFSGYVELWHHHYESKEVAKANAELIAEAGNIRQQIPFSLTELKRQRDEMLEFIKNYYRYLNLDDQKVAEKLIKEATTIN